MSLGFGVGMFEVLFILVFILIIGTIIANMVRGARQWNKNNNSPRLTIPATVVAKRENVSSSHHHSVNHHHHHHTSTTYYVTFQVESGDRMEVQVPGNEYGMLVEGDYGNLSFQGTRYLGFVRL